MYIGDGVLGTLLILNTSTCRWLLVGIFARI
jgi:hypothetical protein